VQSLADIFNRPVSAVAEPHQVIARGTALYALHRGGLLSADDLNAMVDVATRMEPQPEYRGTYERLQTQFVAAFEALRPIYASLNS